MNKVIFATMTSRFIFKKKKMFDKTKNPIPFILSRNKIVLLTILLFVVSPRPLPAQNSLVTQTIKQAKTLRNEKKFGEAAKVLGDFEKKYPGNLWVEQLYAQTLFWMKDYAAAEVIYKRAIGFHPENAALRYDYAVLLFARDKLGDAARQLQVFIRLKPGDAGAEALLGKILYYQAQFKRAEKHLARAAQLNPADKKTETLFREVYRIVSPQLSLLADYLNDDQPLQSFGSQLKFHWFLSDALDFDVSGSGFRYSDIPDGEWITTAELGNRFHLRKAGMELRLAGTWFYARTSQARDWGGSVRLDKKFGKLFRLNLEAIRTNYTYTIASVNNNLLMMNQYSIDLAIGNSGGWNGMAGARYQFFPDNNYVDAFYAWFLSKPLHFSGFKLAFGYAFNYMDSKEDRFEPVAGTVGPGGQTTNTVKGVYVPYFTPHNQYAHSVLLNLSWQVSPYTTVYGHASAGVYSKTYAPGYSLSNGYPEKNFSYQNYTPLDLGVRLQTDISRKAALGLGYTFLQTYYYSSHNVQFSFHYYF